MSCSSDSPFRRKRLLGLDGIRALAVGVVMIYHFAPSSGVPGDIGVTVFFVLSGFLITTLLRRESQVRGRISLGGFYRRRLLRILPAYYVYLMLAGGLVWLTGRHWATNEGLAAWAYVSDYYLALKSPPSSAISHAWSLAVEEQFYLLWPLMRVWFGRRTPSRIGTGLAVAILAVVFWRTCLVLAFGDRAYSYIYHAFDSRADALALGCLAAIVVESPVGLRCAAMLSVSPLLPILSIGALFACRVFIPARGHFSVGLSLEALAACILVVQVIQLADTWAWRWLESRLMCYLGALSYSLYLFHPFGRFVARRFDGSELVAVLAGTCISLLMAGASYHFVEQPFLRLKERRSAQGAGVSPA